MIRKGCVAGWSIAMGAVLLAVPAPSNAAEGTQEAWDAVYIKGSRVGYFHTKVMPIKDPKSGRDLVNVQVDMALSFKRNGDPVSIETLYGTIETPEGAVLRLDSRTLASRQEMRIHGDVINGEMLMILDGAGQKQEKRIAWGSDVRGPYGAEMSMVRKPLEPGESRDVKIFIPDLNRIAVARLAAKGVENVMLGGGVKRDLLRVEQVTLSDNEPLPGMTQSLWTDSAGQILRTSNDSFGGYETYRTSKDAALRNFGESKFDLNAATETKVSRRINNPTNSKQVVYDVTMRNDDPAKVFPNDARQRFTPGAPGSGRLIVTTAGPDTGDPGPETVDAQYLRANALITSEDSRVVTRAKQAVNGLTDPWAKAGAIQHWVFENIKTKNFETTFAAANEVARDLEGDCTEHSVLAAAMCRASGIPARVVVGLLYVDQRQSFGFHMWNEVYVNRRWVAIDAAWDQTAVDATHIKLADSSLDGVSPTETFLAVVRVCDKTKIEPVEVR